MERERLFSLLTYDYEKDNEELGMILSNHIDHGNYCGGLISVKAFPQLIEDIKLWRINKNQHHGL